MRLAACVLRRWTGVGKLRWLEDNVFVYMWAVGMTGISSAKREFSDSDLLSEH